VVGTAGSGHTITKNIVRRNGFASGDVEAVSGERGMGIWSDTVNSPNPSGVTISHNWVELNRNSGILSENENGTQIHGNVSINQTTASAYTRGIYIVCSNANYPSQNAKVFNNTVYGNNIGVNVSGVSGSANTCLNNILKNNIISGNFNRELRANDGGENDGIEGNGNVYEYNCLGAQTSNFIEWGDGIYNSTYDDWETAYGGTTNSVEEEPLFTDTSNDDFTLRIGSPAVDAGENLGAFYDDALNPESSWPSSVSTLDQDDYGPGWDIGAFISTSVGAPQHLRFSE
jgi:hypothetical protein